MKKGKPVASYAKMWPRELFDCKNGKRLFVKELEILSKPGVYVLYRNDIPYYVGKAKRLRSRLWSHANQPGSKYYNFWNYFSVFAVEDVTIRGQLTRVRHRILAPPRTARPGSARPLFTCSLLWSATLKPPTS